MRYITLRFLSSLVFIVMFDSDILLSQPNIQSQIESNRHARIMFYNCENLFDCVDDTLTIDEEFLPNGDRHWDKYKYNEKLEKTAQVITAVGGWQPVELVGLSEIENKQVLNDLVYNSQLYLKEYKFIHKESSDKRGIDVALLYQPTVFKPIANNFIPVNFSDTCKKSRDILYCKGVLKKTDTLHVFVNHWPSRWGGQLESEIYRIEAAKTLKQSYDSITKTEKQPNIIIMGDFNDTPNDISLCLHLNTCNSPKEKNVLVNLSPNVRESEIGTHKHNGVWAVLDQIIVSEQLTHKDNNLHISKKELTIVNYNFLLEPDKNYLGLKPKRTFIGFKFNDGYSDHLPVFIDLIKE